MTIHILGREMLRKKNKVEYAVLAVIAAVVVTVVVGVALTAQARVKPVSPQAPPVAMQPFDTSLMRGVAPSLDAECGGYAGRPVDVTASNEKELVVALQQRVLTESVDSRDGVSRAGLIGSQYVSQEVKDITDILVMIWRSQGSPTGDIRINVPFTCK